MIFNPNIHQRRSVRLKDYDYSQPGAYFVTRVTQGRDCLFGEVTEGEIVLNWYGKIVHRAWMDLPQHYPYISLDAFILKPNHVHVIVVFYASDAGSGGPAHHQA